MMFSLTNPYFALWLENEEDKNKIINDFMFFEEKVKNEAQYTVIEYKRQIDLGMQEVKYETNYNWILGSAKINGPYGSLKTILIIILVIKLSWQINCLKKVFYLGILKLLAV